MSTPAFPQTPSEPTVPAPSEPTAPTPSEPSIPAAPETQPAPAGEAAGAGAADTSAEDDDAPVGSAETVADNAAEEAVVDAVDPGGSPE